MNSNSFRFYIFTILVSFHGLYSLSAQSTKEDILRKKEYTLEEWYDLTPYIYSILLKPTAGEFSVKIKKMIFFEKKNVSRDRKKQGRAP